SIYDGNNVLVSIVGDAEALRYLGDLLHYMAKIEVDKQDMPLGARAHIPLIPGRQLIEHSCEVQICRAEAKGTGEYPAYFADAKRTESKSSKRKPRVKAANARNQGRPRGKAKGKQLVS